jgi:hypothetical protein
MQLKVCSLGAIIPKSLLMKVLSMILLLGNGKAFEAADFLEEHA